MDDSSPSLLEVESVIRKSPCRYGRGCTHVHDPLHFEKFCHPAIQEFNAEDIRRNYMCNECGQGYDSLADLRFHLQKKTAWSNESLVGCRISCLVDSKEWHEGIVTHFHKSGKHCVEFRGGSENRWFHMLKLAFYIIEPMVDQNEFKDNGDSDVAENAASTRLEWTYFEDISIDYAFSQSVLFKVYGGAIQETGHKTRGHVSLTEHDRYIAKSQKGSLLYGELLPRGVNKALDCHHLDAAKAKVLYDMGMGTGKVAIQAFLQYRNLVYVFGVELSVGRYLVAEAAALRMVQLLGHESFHVDVIHGEQITVTEVPAADSDKGRTLKLQCGNMLEVKDMIIADIVMMETDIPAHLQYDLCTMLQQQMRDTARILSYHDLFKIWPLPLCPFKQVDSNCSMADRFPTSWSVQRGHHFFLFRKFNRLSAKNTFQRHLQRTIGRSAESSNSTPNNSNAFTRKSPDLSRASGKKTSKSSTAASQGATPGLNCFSGGQYREGQSYANGCQSLVADTRHYDAPQFHAKEVPRINISRRNCKTVDVVDESSSCGCFVCPSWSRMFSRRSPAPPPTCKELTTKNINERLAVSRDIEEQVDQVERYHSSIKSVLSTSSLPSPDTLTLGDDDVQRSFKSPRSLQASSPRPLSPSGGSSAKSSPVKVIMSSSTRCVLVEQQKLPRTEPNSDVSE